MKQVLISIQPKWCEKIVSGEKTIEVRKTKPKCATPFKCYIYCTKKERLLHIFHKDEYIFSDDHSQGKFDENIFVKNDYAFSGKVIGEFVCDKISDYHLDPNNPFDNVIYYDIQEQELWATCLTDDDLAKYGKGKTLYGWHISELKIYEKPKELSEFYKPCVDKYGYCQGCKYGFITVPADEEEYAMYHDGNYDYFDEHCTNYLTKAPQSWCYLEERE